MAAPRFRLIDDAEWQARPLPRVVNAGDAPFHSPARALQSQLWRRAATPGSEHDRWPGAIRLAIPLAASAVLWGAILKAAGLY